MSNATSKRQTVPKDHPAPSLFGLPVPARAVLIVVVTCLVYLPALSGEFVWDNVKVLAGSFWGTLAGLRAIWLEITVEGFQYYPLTQTTFWLEYQLWGLWPVGYHFTNIALHAGNAMLLGLVLQRLAVPGAWLTAALFAVHPVHVESVAWVAERKNVLSMCFALSSLLCYWRFSPPWSGEGKSALHSNTEGRGNARHYWRALGLYVCGLLSKTVICSLPAVILLLHWWKRGRLSWREVRPLVPFFALGLLASGLTVVLEEELPAVQHLSFLERLLVPGRALWFYVGKLLWPHPLIFIYPRWAIDATVVWQWCFPLAALLLTALLFLWRRRLGRGPLVAWLLFAGVLAPTLGFFNVYFHRFSFVADHFQYHASAALMALAGAVVWRLPSQRARAGAALVLLLPLGITTWRQCYLYQTPGTLWGDTVMKNPSIGVAHDNLGVHLLQHGDHDGARRHFQTAVRLDPAVAKPRFNLAFVLFIEGKIDDALQAGLDAIRLGPDVPEHYLLLAHIYAAKGDAEQAAYYEREADARAPTTPQRE